MDHLPETLYYTAEHHWIEPLASGRYRVGLTGYAAQHLGEVYSIDLPEINDAMQADEAICAVESEKATSSILAPCAGVIVGINDELRDASSLLNQEPFSDGWLFEFTSEDPKLLKGFLSVQDYTDLIQPHAEADQIEGGDFEEEDDANW